MDPITYRFDERHKLLRKNPHSSDEDLSKYPEYKDGHAEFWSIELRLAEDYVNRTIRVATGTETQWKGQNLIEGEDFICKLINLPDGQKYFAYPLNPIFTLDEMIHAYKAGFEGHKVFPDIAMDGPRNLYFKSHYLVNLENYTHF
jgi:hypothetical protein